MCDESLTSLDSMVQQMSEAEYNSYMKGYNDALTERYRCFHLKYIIRSILRGKLFCATCNKFMLRSKVQDYRTGFCSVECRDNYIPF